MKKIICILIISALLALLITGCSGKSENSNENSDVKYDENNVGEIYAAEIDPEHIAIGKSEIKYVDNEVLLVAKNEVPKNEIEALAKNINAEIVGYIEQTGDYQLKFPQVMTEKEVGNLIADLKGNSLIESASFNYVFDIENDSVDYNINDGNKWSTGSTPNLWQGPLLALLLKNNKAWGVNAINAPLAWSTMNTIKEEINPVKVGLIDNGFDETHEDLTFKQVFYENGANSVDVADEAHGTHVAGTMAARGDNKNGICGVYPYSNGRLYAASWSGAKEYKLNQSSSSFVDMVCLAELVLRNVKVVNASYGFADYATWYNDEDAINMKTESAKQEGNFLKRLLEKGYDFVIVVAAGNDSTQSEHLDSTYCTLYAAIPNDEEYKDVYNRIIVVGSIGRSLDISNFSNAGERTEIYAPGEAIYSTVPENDYSYNIGTSMAAPHVAGVAANVWSINNGLSGDEVKRIVCSSVNVNSKDGVPVVDCAVAVKKAIEGNDNLRMDEVQNGGILGWVFEGDDRSTPIENVSVVPYSNGTALTDYGVTTDAYGHFELIIPSGDYELHFTKGEDYDEKILSATVSNGEVNYLNEGIDEVIGLDKCSDTIYPTQYLGLTFKELKQLLGNNYIYSPNGHGIFYFDFETSPYSFVFATSDHDEIIQILDGDSSILDDVKLSVVSISTQEENIIIPNQIYTNHETYNSLKTKSTKMSFSENTIWGTICDINVDGFLIRYVWLQGYSSDKIADYVLLYQKDDIFDSSNHINDEERLKNNISDYGIIGAWHYDDYDGNGDKEAFAVIISDNDENSRPIEAVYYIDSTGKAQLMNDDLKWSLYISQNGCYRECSGKGFFWFDMGAYGSGWYSAVYSVKDGVPYELDISQNIQGFYQDENNKFYTTKDEFLPGGGHLHHDYELIFNGSTQQFSVGNKIDVANQTTESNDNPSSNMEQTENQTAEQLRRNIVGDWVEYSFDENGNCYFYGDQNNSGTYEITESKTLIIKFPWTKNTYTWSEKNFNDFHKDHDYDEYFWCFTNEGVLRLNGTDYYRNGVFFSSD